MITLHILVVIKSSQITWELLKVAENIITAVRPFVLVINVELNFWEVKVRPKLSDVENIMLLSDSLSPITLNLRNVLFTVQ